MNIKILTLSLCLFLVTGVVAEAQHFKHVRNRYDKLVNRHNTFSFTAGAGISSYFGDLKGNSFDLMARPSIQLGVQYRVNNNLHIRSEVMWYRIAGADSLNDPESSIFRRNLSFRADNFEWNVVGLWQFFNKFSRYNRPTFNPYGFAGIGMTTNNPKAYYQGEWQQLRPLMTEGQSYSPMAIVIPFGLGVTYHINNNWDLSFEYGYRYAFTDYLDDVSTTHIGVDNFSNPLAAALSDRRPEIGVDPVPAGNQRGNNNANDWYLTTGLKVTYTPGLSYKNPKFR